MVSRLCVLGLVLLLVKYNKAARCPTGWILDANYWIGLSDKNTEGKFVWSSTNAVATYTDWGKGEPNDNGNEDCAYYMATTDQKWNDYFCDSKVSYICEQKAVVPMCPDGWVLGGQSCYFFSTDSKNWNDARTACTNKGGDLVEISSAEENTRIKSELPSASHYWIGLNDKNKEGTFVWISTNAVATYTDWNTGEPNNENDNEDCVHLWAQRESADRKWNDRPCDTEKLYICEKMGFW